MQRTRKKLWKQLTAMMLAVTLIVTSVDLTAFAAPADETVTEQEGTAEESTHGTEPEEEMPEELSGLEADGIPVEYLWYSVNKKYKLKVNTVHIS